MRPPRPEEGIDEHRLDVIARARGPRAAELTRRLLEGGAPLRLVNRAVMETARFGLWDEEGVPLAEEAARLWALPLPAWTHEERIALLTVYVERGRAAFDHAVRVLEEARPGMVRCALAFWAADGWDTFEEARRKVPAALVVMAQRRRMTVERLLELDLGEDNLVLALREFVRTR